MSQTGEPPTLDITPARKDIPSNKILLSSRLVQTLDFLDGAAVSLVDAAIIVPSFPVISDVGIHREHSYRMSGILKDRKQSKARKMQWYDSW